MFHPTDIFASPIQLYDSIIYWCNAPGFCCNVHFEDMITYHEPAIDVWWDKKWILDLDHYNNQMKITGLLRDIFCW